MLSHSIPTGTASQQAEADRQPAAPELTTQKAARMARIGLVIAILLYLFLAQRVFVYCPDDAFITYRYSVNVAQGYGPVFNRNAPISDRTEGFSCPLFMLLTALVSKLPLPMDLLLRMKFFGIVCAIGTFVLVQKLARRLGLPGWAVGLVPVLLAVHPAFVTNSIDGMETALAALLTTWAALRFLEEGNERGTENRDADFIQNSKSAGSAMLFAFAALVRPEALLLGLLAGGLLLAAKTISPPHKTRWLLTFLLPVVAYFLWRRWFYGLWMPNTFYAKSVTLEYGLTKGLAYLARAYFPDFTLTALPLLIGGFWWLLVLGGASSDRVLRGAGRILVLLVAGQMLFVLRAGGDWMRGWRYMAPVLPLLTVLTVIALAELEVAIRAKSLPSARLAPFAAGLIAKLAIAGAWFAHDAYLAVPFDGYQSWASHRFSLRERDLTRGWQLEQQVYAAQNLERALPSGSNVLYSEMGYLPYLTPNLRYLDQHGLTDHQVATLPNVEHMQVGVGGNYFDASGNLRQYLIEERRPDFIIAGDAMKEGQASVAPPLYDGAYVPLMFFPVRFSDSGPPIAIMRVWKRRDRP